MTTTWHAFVLFGLICLFLISVSLASGQVPTPRSYLFVEVKDTMGEVVHEASVSVTSVDGKELRSGLSDNDGHARLELFQTSDHHYGLHVSKAGYQSYEEVVFRYSQPYRSDGELFPGLPDPESSQAGPIKIVLLKAPARPVATQVAEVEEKKRQLILAAKRGDTAAVRKLLQAGVSPNTVDTRGIPVIAWAALAGNAETIDALLAAGAQVRNKDNLGNQALLIYLSEGIFRESQIRKSTLAGVAAENELGARQEGREGTISRLIRAGAGVNIHVPDRGTVLNRAIALTADFPQASYYSEALYLVSLKTIKALLAAGADANSSDDKGQTPLMSAARKPAVEVMELLLASGATASINVKDKHGETALLFAISRDHAENPKAVRVLLGAGPQVNLANEAGQNALMLAAQINSLEIVRLLLAAGSRASINSRDKDGQTALMYSCSPSFYPNSKDVELIRLLIQEGAQVNEKDAEGRTPLMHASKTFTIASLGLIRLLIREGARINEKDSRGWTALMYAAPQYYNDSSAALVKVLIEEGAEVDAVNEEGQTALMLASKWYDEAGVKLLLAAGASVNLQDKSGMTALMHACQTTAPIDVAVFIKAGAAASINAKDKPGWTALMYAVDRYYAAKDAKALIASGADVNEVNDEGQTPLMLAAQTGSIDIVKTLLEAGASASINVKDKQGRTALMYVRPKYSYEPVTEIVDALTKAGATAEVPR